MEERPARFFRRLVTWAGGLVVTLVLIAVTMGRHLNEPSGYSNCVIVTDESAFVGERLKFSDAKFHGPKPTDECVAEDAQIDSGDGPLRGKVRWVECSKGPDCHEAAMY